MNTTEAGSPMRSLPIVEGIALDRPFEYAIAVEKGGLVRVTVDGISRSIQLDDSFETSRLYFKAGNYTLDAGGGSALAFEGLGIRHD